MEAGNGYPQYSPLGKNFKQSLLKSFDFLVMSISRIYNCWNFDVENIAKFIFNPFEL